MADGAADDFTVVTSFLSRHEQYTQQMKARRRITITPPTTKPTIVTVAILQQKTGYDEKQQSESQWEMIRTASIFELFKRYFNEVTNSFK